MNSNMPWRTLGLAATVIAVAASPQAKSILALERQAVLSGQVWRLWTGHIIHGSFYHFFWNILALIVLGLLFEARLRGFFWTLLAVSAPLIGISVLFLPPAIEVYYGLSGLLNTIWMMGALMTARFYRNQGDRNRAYLFYACAVGNGIKIAIEILTGDTIFTDGQALGGIPVPSAHAIGALAGVLGSLVCAIPCQNPTQPCGRNTPFQGERHFGLTPEP